MDKKYMSSDRAPKLSQNTKYMATGFKNRKYGQPQNIAQNGIF